MQRHNKIPEAVTILIICIGLPLTLVAIYALRRQVRKDHVAPIYVINLLISDLIQFFHMIYDVTPHHNAIITIILGLSRLFALVVSGGFMVCIAVERYLVIAHPQWYHCRRTIKSSVAVCVLVWVLPLAFLLPVLFLVHAEIHRLIFGIFFLLPLPLLISVLGGTLKALSASIPVPSAEKRQTVGILITLLLIHMLCFLPNVILMMAARGIFNYTFIDLFAIFVQCGPLADLILYFFMRKGTTDTEGNKQYNEVEIKNRKNINNSCDQLLQCKCAHASACACI